MATTEPTIQPDRVYARITRRLVPFLFVCYAAAYLDRVNIGFAKLQLQDDLQFSDTVYGIGAGMFLPRPPKDEGSAAYDCPWCDVDGLGATTATEAWDRKRDGAAQLRLMLHGPEAM